MYKIQWKLQKTVRILQFSKVAEFSVNVQGGTIYNIVDIQYPGGNSRKKPLEFIY